MEQSKGWLSPTHEGARASENKIVTNKWGMLIYGSVNIELLTTLMKHVGDDGVMINVASAYGANMALAFEDKADEWVDAVEAAAAERFQNASERWLNGAHVGKSSKSLCLAIANDRAPSRVYLPSDPSDFSRCVIMVDACDVTPEQLARAAELMPEWKGIIGRWDHFVSLLEKEEYETLYDLLKELERERASLTHSPGSGGAR